MTFSYFTRFICKKIFITIQRLMNSHWLLESVCTEPISCLVNILTFCFPDPFLANELGSDWRRRLQMVGTPQLPWPDNSLWQHNARRMDAKHRRSCHIDFFIKWLVRLQQAADRLLSRQLRWEQLGFAHPTTAIRCRVYTRNQQSSACGWCHESCTIR